MLRNAENGVVTPLDPRVNTDSKQNSSKKCSEVHHHGIYSYICTVAQKRIKKTQDICNHFDKRKLRVRTAEKHKGAERCRQPKQCQANIKKQTTKQALKAFCITQNVENQNSRKLKHNPTCLQPRASISRPSCRTSRGVSAGSQGPRFRGPLGTGTGGSPLVGQRRLVLIPLTTSRRKSLASLPHQTC